MSRTPCDFYQWVSVPEWIHLPKQEHDEDVHELDGMELHDQDRMGLIGRYIDNMAYVYSNCEHRTSYRRRLCFLMLDEDA